MKNKLIKAYNEMYFRDYRDSKLTKVTGNETHSELDTLLNISLGINEELSHLVMDLITQNYGTTDNKKVFSKVGAEVEENKKRLEAKFSSNFKTTYLTNEVATLLNSLSTESYFVGGCVRDSMIGKPSKDVDFCTDTPVDKLVEVFKANGYTCDEVGLQFLVLFVSKHDPLGEEEPLGGTETFEIANFRKDKDNSGGEIGDIYTDAQRRDFTVNAGYVRIQDGKLFDPNEQFVDDLMSRTLKFVGKATDRLEEDYIRGYRFMRFLGRGFEADKKSLQAVRQYWSKIHTECNPERVRLEIEKMVNL